MNLRGEWGYVIEFEQPDLNVKMHLSKELSILSTDIKMYTSCGMISIKFKYFHTQS